MNIDDMAHDYAKIFLESELRNNPDFSSIKEVVRDAYWLAKAMQVESMRLLNPVVCDHEAFFNSDVKQYDYFICKKCGETIDNRTSDST